MSNLNVLIVGASIAGPSAAYWFAKAGANVTIIERFPQIRPGGQNVDIRNVGVTVMRKIPGMEGAVRAKKCPMEGICFVDGNGKTFATLEATGDPDQQSLVSEYEIFRGDLAQILVDMTKDDKKVRYVYGEQIATLKQNGDEPVTVEFTNGYPTSQYDLVVACDGATSRTRAMGFDCGVRDHVKSLNCWAAYFSIKEDLLQGGKMGKGYSVVGGRFFAIGPDSSSSNRATLMGHFPGNATDATLPFREAQKKGTDELRQYVYQHHNVVGWKSKEILDAMMTTDDFYASEVVQVKIPSLYKGRFVLLGDAGYSPANGAGTSLAIAGAYLLAGEVSKHDGDLEAGLQGYEQRMRPIINDMQTVPPGFSSFMAPQTAWGLWLRNWVVTILSWSMVFSGVFGWIGSFLTSSFASDKFGIPDYEWKN